MYLSRHHRGSVPKSYLGILLAHHLLLQLAFCPEAMVHLQEMKDEMIAVANELLDDDGELNLQRSEELRKKRFDSLFYLSVLL